MRSLCLALVLALLAASCAGPEDELEGAVFEGEDGKADDSVERPYGSWSRELASGEYGFFSLTLTEDRHFHYLQRLVRCREGECVDELTGRYRFAYSHGKTYVVVYNDDLRWYSFEYAWEGDELRLRTTGTSRWFTLARSSEAWCETAVDCDGQGLASCGATYQCVESVCRCEPGEPEVVAFEVPLLDENDLSLLALRNDEVTAAGFEPIPETALIAADQGGYEAWSALQRRIDELDEAMGLGTWLFGYGSPYEYQAARADGTAVELCFHGPVEGVPEALTALTDSVFSDQLQVYAWRYGEVEGFDEHTDPDEGLDWLPEEWSDFDGSDGSIFVVTAVSDSGDDLTPNQIPPCR